MRDNIFRRVVSVMLVAVIMFGMFPTAFAAEGTSASDAITSSPDPPAETVESTVMPVVESEAATQPPTEPSAEVTEATEPSTEATEATEPSTEATEATEPSTEATEATEPSTEATEATEPSTEATEATEPSTEATEATEPSTEATEATEPSTEATEATEPSTEATEATEPSTEATEPEGPVSDPTADVETQADWDASVEDVVLTDDPANNLLAIAKSQIGYKESTRNFILDSNNQMQGYTRYGDWWGSGYEYSEWCAMFVSFCLEYAGITSIPVDASCPNWVETMKSITATTAWYDANSDEYSPTPGDIIFYDLDLSGISDHVGIISEVLKDGSFLVVEGNYDKRVALVKRNNDNTVLGFIPVNSVASLQKAELLETIVEDNTTMIYWLGGAFSTHTISYTDASGVSHSGELNRITNNKLNTGSQAYCIEPIKEHGSSYTENSSVSAWKTMLTANQRKAIALVLAYGYPNTNHADSSEKGAAELYQSLPAYSSTTLAQWKRQEKVAATQIIIWEIVTGARQATHPYQCTDTSLIDAFYYGESNTNSYGLYSNWRTLKKTYDAISASLASHGLPSFCSSTASGAASYKLLPTSSGNYSVTLTDTNGVLSGYSFSSNISGLTFSANGNNLTITATPAAANQIVNGITISDTGPSLDVDPDKVVAVWQSTIPSGAQVIVTLDTSPTALTAYFKLSADATGNATVQKAIAPSSASNASNLQNWRMELYSTQAKAAAGNASDVVAYAYTNSSGVATFSNLTAGTTYYVREAPADRQYNKSTSGWTLSTDVKAVTIVGGSTTSAGTITNGATGNLSITKAITPSSDATATNLENWRMELYSTQANAAAGNAGNVLAYAYTDTSGVATFSDLTAGTTYYVREAPASRQDKRDDTANWVLNTSVKNATVVALTTTSAGTITNEEKVFVSIAKSANCSNAVYNQIQNNPLYSLAGAKYDLYIDGVYQETLTTDANGNATSANRYIYGQSGYLIETYAPPGYAKFTEPYYFTIDSSSLVVSVTDEPVFDPGGIEMTKVDAQTGTAQGNATFTGAIFRWDFYDAASNWSGTPERTWYFQTDASGFHEYSAAYLIDNATYNSDALYYDDYGDESLPLGSIKVTEVLAPAGYVVMSLPLYGTITQNGNSADFSWTPDTLTSVTVTGGDSISFIENADLTSYGSISITKKDAETENGEPHYGTNFAGIEFTVYNRSTGSVKIGDFPTAAPGEACYVITLDEDGKVTTGNDFPIGSYSIKETKGNQYYNCNTEWEGTFTVDANSTVDNPNFSFTVTDMVVKGDFKLYKVEEGTNQNGTDSIAPSEAAITLADAKYKVWNPDGSELGEFTTNENGMIEILDLPYGTYAYQEIEAPAGFELDEIVYDFTIDEEGEVITRVREDKPTVGSIEILKTSDDGSAISGVTLKLEYAIYDEATDTWSEYQPVSFREADSLVSIGGCTSTGLTESGELTTGNDGKVKFNGLRVNSQVCRIQYRITEVSTVSGMSLLSDYAFIGELPYDFNDGEAASVDVVVKIVNSETFTFPATGENDLYMVTLGSLLTVLAVAIFVMVLAPNVFNSTPAVNKKSKNERN